MTQQKNELGIMCMIYGIFFLWMLLSVYRDRKRPGRWRRMLAYGTIIAMSAYLLSQCNSTTSIVGFASSAGVLWLASRRPVRPALVHFAVLGVLGISVTALFFDPGGGLVQSLGKESGAYWTEGDLGLGPKPAYKPVDRDRFRDLLARA